MMLVAILMIIGGAALFITAISILQDDNALGIFIIMGLCFFALGIFTLIIKTEESVRKEILQYMVASNTVELKYYKDTMELEYRLIDSTQTDLFNYLNSNR